AVLFPLKTPVLIRILRQSRFLRCRGRGKRAAPTAYGPASRGEIVGFPPRLSWFFDGGVNGDRPRESSRSRSRDGGKGLALGLEFLDAVVEDIGHVDVAAGVDCDLVGQVELARAAAGGAKRAERLAIRAEDLHAVVAGVDDQDEAVEADRDANRPLQIASAAPRRAELPEVVALAVEDLHAVVPVVGDVDALPGDGDAHWLLELAVPVAETAPLAQEDAAGVELLDAVVLRVGHVDVAVVVNCQRRRSVELAGAAACRAPYAEVLPGGREAPDAVADAVGQVDVARLEIDRDPGQHVVLTPVRPRVAQDVERDAGGREAGDRAGVVDLLLAVDCQDVAVLVDGDVHQRAETAAAGVA